MEPLVSIVYTLQAISITTITVVACRMLVRSIIGKRGFLTCP